jgi:hypothetical protein
VVLHGGLPLGVVRIAEVALAVAHDEHLGDALTLGARVHFREEGRVLGLVLEELVDVLDGVDADRFRDLGEIEVLHRPLEQRLIDGPLRERDLVERRACRLRGVNAGRAQRAERAEGGRSGGARSEKLPTGLQWLHILHGTPGLLMCAHHYWI